MRPATLDVALDMVRAADLGVAFDIVRPEALAPALARLRPADFTLAFANKRPVALAAFFAGVFGVTWVMEVSTVGVLAMIALVTISRFAIKDFFSTLLSPNLVLNFSVSHLVTSYSATVVPI